MNNDHKKGFYAALDKVIIMIHCLMYSSNYDQRLVLEKLRYEIETMLKEK